MPNAYYLKLDSGADQVFGNSRDRYHVGWIKIRTFAAAVTGPRPDSSAGGKTTVRAFELSKLTDRTSTEILRAKEEAREFKTAVIEVADERTGIPKVRISFKQVTIDSFDLGSDRAVSDVGPAEAFTLGFESMEYNYNPIPEESIGDLLQSVFKTLGLAPA